MINSYPYLAYSSDPQHVSLDYALFKSTSPVVTDDGGYKYYNLFDAMLDAYHAAFWLVEPHFCFVSEIGWPSARYEPYTSKLNAQVYNKNSVQRVIGGKGNSRRPGVELIYWILVQMIKLI